MAQKGMTWLDNFARMLQDSDKGFQLSPVTGLARRPLFEGGLYALELICGEAEEASFRVNLDSQEGEVGHGTFQLLHGQRDAEVSTHLQGGL